MTHARKGLGQRGEDLAAEKLTALGYALVARNYRCAYGEIDLIARQGETLVFAEVRTRRGQQFGAPEESITARKREHLIAAAQNYLQENNLRDENWRIDVVAVEMAKNGKLVRVDVLENAVTG
jgi:putative endonuclease